MTWKEFKTAVESRGVEDEDCIFLIDTGSYPNERSLRIDVLYHLNGERDICVEARKEKVPTSSGAQTPVYCRSLDLSAIITANAEQKAKQRIGAVS